MPILGTIASSFDNTVVARGLFGGGNRSGTLQNIIDYVEIATTGNATDFGDLSVTRENTNAAASNCHGGL